MAKNFCTDCGHRLKKSANFCPNCGNQILHQDKLTDRPAKNPNSANHQPLTRQTDSRKFARDSNARHSQIITTDNENGEPIVTVRNLHPNAIWLFFFQYLGKSMILLLLFVITAVFQPLLSILVIIIYFLILFLIAKINFKNYEFEISPYAFRKIYGVFHKYTVNIAFDQIQNINMRRSVIDQILGLAHLEIETAGTGGRVKTSIGGLLTRAEGYIPGITPDEAKDIKQLMLARIQQD